MSEQPGYIAEPTFEAPRPRALRQSDIVRVLGYTSMRGLSLFITAVIAVYITILVANMGGYVDEIMKGLIEENLTFMTKSGWLKDLPPDEKLKAIDEARQAMYEAEGPNQPFVLRSLRWLKNGLTLNLGESRIYVSLRYGIDSNLVKDIILDNLPRTLLLFATANVLLFFGSVWAALVVTRRPGSLLDKIFIALSPISSAPPWFYGVFLIVIFAVQLRWLPYGGMYATDPAESQKYGPTFTILRHMVLPVSAIFLSAFFQSVYSWRTFFLIYSHDDYVEMAYARGLPNRIVEGQYLLRPALPSLLTSFAFLLISSWSGSVLLELVFDWPGMGLVFFNSVRLFDTPVIVGFTIIYAYMLALTVLLLDVTYALVDPRVKIDLTGQARNIRLNVGLKTFFENLVRPRTGTSKESAHSDWKLTVQAMRSNVKESLQNFGRTFREILGYPSAVAGLLIILTLIVTSVYISTTISSYQAIRIWRGQDYDWSEHPQLVPPAWINFFRKDDLPETLTFDSRDKTTEVSTLASDAGMTRVEMRFPINYHYTGGFPQDLMVVAEPTFESKPSFISLTLIAPDGSETPLSSFIVEKKVSYYLSQDKTMQRKTDSLHPEMILFSDGDHENPKPQTGQYQLLAQIIHFEPNAEMNVRVVLHGQVYGWAGTDMRRRDLGLPLLWGMPIALLFGLLAVTATTVMTMIIAAVGTWFGGWVDAFVQRLTEVNMILPLFPVLVMVAVFYTRSIWLTLGVTILLSIFGSAIKNYRAIFLQFKELPYIEAAQSYGAGSWRIIFRYLVPRILPTLIPQMVILVPGYVFIETSLALMGLSDPSLPTWGKVLREAYDSNALINGHYHWVLEPLAFLLITGLGFALLGFALDRIFNPRLREH